MSYSQSKGIRRPAGNVCATAAPSQHPELLEGAEALECVRGGASQIDRYMKALRDGVTLSS